MKFLLSLLLILPIFGQIIRIPFAERLGIMPTDILVAIILVLWILSSVKQKKPLFTKSIALPSLFFFGWALFSLIINMADLSLSVAESFQSLAYYLRYLAYFLLIFVCIQELKSKKGLEEYFKNLLFFSAFIIAVLGFLQLSFFPSFHDLRMNEIGWDPHIGRLLSTWFDPNFLGGYFVFVLSLLGGEIWLVIQKLKCIKAKGFLRSSFHSSVETTEKGKGLKLKQNNRDSAAITFRIFILSVIFITLLTALVLTYSRSSYLAFIVAGGVFALIAERRLIIIGLIVIALALGFSSRMQERTLDAVRSAQALFTQTEKTLDPTSRLRVKSWEVGMSIFKEKPITGIGFNTLRTQQKKYWSFLTKSHAGSGIDASLLTVLATTGIIGLYGFLWLWGKIILLALSNFIKEKDGFSLGLFAGFLGILVHSVFVNTLFFSLFLPTLVLACSLTLYKKES